MLNRKFKQLVSGLLGAAVFFGVWAGAAALAHTFRFPPWFADVALALSGIATYSVYVRTVERRNVTELEPRAALSQTAAGFGAGIILFGIVITALALSGHYHVSGIGDPVALLRALVPWFSGAIMEELLFRGFVFRVLRDVTGMWIALAISAALFGFLHAANPGATPFSSIAIALEAGVLLAVAYAATNRLWLPIGIHAGWNYAEGTIFGTAVSGGVVKSTFLHGTLTGNSLWTGGAFGVEASIVAIPVCLAAAALLVLRVKRERLVEATA